METQIDSAPATWSAAECPFTVEYLPRVLDDIRLAVMDAFFSLPRGGAEIGGILLGRHDPRGILITDSVALDCEHAFGPSFSLSPADLARLSELLAAAGGNPGSQPLGWYHSHTRSEIFLSDADQEIHRRFFPEPWQVALVLKPHTFQPTRAGFFFQDRDGAIHAPASYHEFLLDPLPVRPMPLASSAALPAPAPPPPSLLRQNGKAGPIIDVAPLVDAAPAAPPPQLVSPEPAPVPVPAPEIPPPAFLAAPPRSSRRWVGFLAVALGAGLAAGVYQTRASWLPRINLPPSRPAPPAQPPIALNTLDREGQLQILWNGEAPDLRRSSGGTLLIADGTGAPHSIALDAAHLRAGSFTYSRQGEQVDVTLSVNRSDGQKLTESAAFLGKLPPRAAATGDPYLRRERDDLARQLADLKVDLANQAARNKVLEKALADVREAYRREALRKRLENQTPDPGK